MNMHELRKKSIHDLNAELCHLLQEQFNLKMKVSSEKSPNSHVLRKIRRNIVLIKTLITEKKESIS